MHKWNGHTGQYVWLDAREGRTSAHTWCIHYAPANFGLAKKGMLYWLCPVSFRLDPHDQAEDTGRGNGTVPRHLSLARSLSSLDAPAVSGLVPMASYPSREARHTAPAEGGSQGKSLEQRWGLDATSGSDEPPLRGL